MEECGAVHEAYCCGFGAVLAAQDVAVILDAIGVDTRSHLAK
jgi:hypothetical protein